MYAEFNDSLKPVLQFSNQCIGNVDKLVSSGYKPYDAVIRFICAWKGEEDTEETAVILVDLYFSGDTGQ